ncbi:DUF6978 family protein [Paramaledivibacter caminithermalis]|jgi:hypothetical protein|uniref:Lj965 prophage protein n=1 Tax=Paramaledivibacter caminithermalis (strain DSM 15212 / CIP 107654 / DViRD3) TaxID=1121301 RepID=A0A1M6TDS1_PARC5|nr:hypothetical protein [Paramaledivibacter caminithermalis]SHK55137.1 hypothetical protein SAMN02745912_03654 [Paramaledivibacter caminithermalis DSM 15212]
MLIQEIADNLIIMKKNIIDNDIVLPIPNDFIKINVASIDNKEKFILDVNRKGTFKLTRCTYQERYQTSIPLIRLDVDTKPHRNPDNKVILGTHIHIYKEGYGDKWAFPLDEIENNCFTDLKNLTQTFLDFCQYCNIENIPSVQEVI